MYFVIFLNIHRKINIYLGFVISLTSRTLIDSVTTVYFLRNYESFKNYKVRYSFLKKLFQNMDSNIEILILKCVLNDEKIFLQLALNSYLL